MTIQAYLTAAAVNLKRLAAVFSRPLLGLVLLTRTMVPIEEP